MRDSKCDVNNKSNEGLQSLLKVVDKERSKRRKNKLKNTTHEYVENCSESNEINPARANDSSTRSFKDGVKRVDSDEWNHEKKKKESKKSAVGDV